MKGKFGCMTRKIKNKSNYIKWGLLILFVMAVIFFTAYFFGMMLFVEGKIVEDRPLWELACKARPLCYTWNTALSCSGPAYNIDEVIENGKLNDYYLAKQISSEVYSPLKHYFIFIFKVMVLRGIELLSARCKRLYPKGYTFL